MVQCYPRFLINNEEKDPKETQIGTDAGVEMRKYIREELIPKRKEELKTDKNKQDILSRLLRISFLDESKLCWYLVLPISILPLSSLRGKSTAIARIKSVRVFTLDMEFTLV